MRFYKAAWTYRILALLLMCNIGLVGYSQTFVSLEDASGVYATPPDQSEIEVAAQSLRDIFPVEFREEFKVFDFGFYLHHKVTKGSYPEALMQKIEEASSLSPYYILFGRQYNEEDQTTAFWKVVNLPRGGDLACIENLGIDAWNQLDLRLQGVLDRSRLPIGGNYINVEREALTDYKEALDGLFECCTEVQGLKSMSVGCRTCISNPVDMVQFYADKGYLLQEVRLDNEAIVSAKARTTKSIQGFGFLEVFIGDDKIELDSWIEEIKNSAIEYCQGAYDFNPSFGQFTFDNFVGCTEYEDRHNQFEADDISDFKLSMGLVDMLDGSAVLAIKTSAKDKSDHADGDMSVHLVNEVIDTRDIDRNISVGNAIKSQFTFTDCASVLSDDGCNRYAESRDDDANLLKYWDHAYSLIVAEEDNKALRLATGIVVNWTMASGALIVDRSYIKEWWNKVELTNIDYTVLSLMKGVHCQENNCYDFTYINSGTRKGNKSDVLKIDDFGIMDIQASDKRNGELYCMSPNSVVQTTHPYSIYKGGRGIVPRVTKMEYPAISISGTNDFVLKIILSDSESIMPLINYLNGTNLFPFDAITDAAIVNELIKMPCSQEKQTELIRILATAPKCVYKELSNSDRIDLLNCLTAKSLVYKQSEAIIVKVFQSIDNSANFVTEANDRLLGNQLAFKMDEREISAKLIEEVIRVYNESNHANVENTKAKYNLKVGFRDGFGFLVTEYKTEYDYKKDHSVCYKSVVKKDQVCSDGDCTATDSIVDIYGPLNYFDPLILVVDLNVHADIGAKYDGKTVPAIAVPIIYNNFKEEQFYRELVTTANVASLFLGVGELSGIIQAGVKTYTIYQKFRIAFTISDLAITSFDLVCDNDGSRRYCQEYKKYAPYLAVANFGGNLALTNFGRKTDLIGDTNILPKNADFNNFRNWIAELEDLPVELYKYLRELDPTVVKKLGMDLVPGSAFYKHLVANPDQLKAWDIFKKSPDARISALATDIPQLEKFTDIVKANNLGLDEASLGNLLNAKTATHNFPWEHPDKILDAVKRGSDANIDAVTIKGFPTPSEGNTSFVLANAKQYQLEGSGDALLSFDKGGRSFDNVTPDGILIDRKYGHGKSIFNEDLSVHNQVRRDKIVETANAQVAAANGTPIRWEVSTERGANGIQKLFDDLGIDIDVDWIEQIEIVNP